MGEHRSVQRCVRRRRHSGATRLAGSAAVSVLGSVLALAVLAMPPVAAETSSWTKRPDVAPPVAGAKPAPKTMARPPALGPEGGRLPRGALPEVDAHPATFSPFGLAGYKKLQVSGEDAAYIAFAQGQYLTAKALAEADAARGIATGCTILGRIYAEGLGVSRDEALAAEWFERGAELGETEAAFAYGLMLAEGTGVAKDKVKAGQMFEFVARTGHPLANYNLALLFLTGQGKPENPARAAQHLQYAAEKGVAAAQYDLATLYAEGVGVKPDAFEAARWMRRAAEQGMRIAEFDYGVMLLRGFGLNADRPKAVAYLRAAANKGVAGAQNRMAYLLLEGVIVAPSPAEAVKWRTLARERGLEDAALDKMVEQLPAKVKAEGQRAALEWWERASLELSN